MVCSRRHALVLYGSSCGRLGVCSCDHSHGWMVTEFNRTWTVFVCYGGVVRHWASSTAGGSMPLSRKWLRSVLKMLSCCSGCRTSNCCKTLLGFGPLGKRKTIIKTVSDMLHHRIFNCLCHLNQEGSDYHCLIKPMYYVEGNYKSNSPLMNKSILFVG